MNEIPVWLPPLPLVLIAAMLFIFGVRTWLRADSLAPPPKQDSHDDHGHGHDGHGHH